MQVVVKKPLIKLEGKISNSLMDFLRREYGEIEVIEDEEEELIEVTKSDWYHSIRGQITPGDNMRIYREIHKLSQEELGRKLGNFSRQNISNMERGRRSISKNVAKTLAELFNVSVEKFV